MWWYIAVLVGSFAMAMATVYTGDSGLPWHVNSYTLLLLFSERNLQVGPHCRPHYCYRIPSVRRYGLCYHRCEEQNKLT